MKPNASTVKYSLKLAGITALYVLAAKFGLSLAFTARQVSAVWPPTGIALAVLVIIGAEYWPAIFLGAFLANFFTHEPWIVATFIAIGNTLEAVAGEYLLQKIGFRKSLSRVKDVVGLVVGAALISTLASATIGAVSLALGHLISWKVFGLVWLIWWVGDMVGDLSFAPLITVWTGRRVLKEFSKRWVEAGLLLSLTFAVSVVIFMQPAVSALIPVSYAVYPFTIWAALRFKQAGSVATTFLISATAIYGTIHGLGPFGGSAPTDRNLIYLHTFLITLAVTAMTLAAVMAEREHTEWELLRQTEALEKAHAELDAANRRVTDILAGILDDDERSMEVVEKNKYRE